MRVSETKIKETNSGLEYFVTLQFGPADAAILASDRDSFDDLDDLTAKMDQKVRDAVRAMR